MLKSIKKLFMLLIVFVLAIALIGCGEEPTPTPGPDDPKPVEEVKPTKIEISGVKEEIKVGEDFTITVKVTPDNATNKNVRYSSSDSSVASVKDGKVTGVSAGEATITVTSAAEKTVKAEFKVTVTSDAEPIVIDPSEIILTINGATEVEKEKMINLSPTITAPDGADKKLQWTSSDEKIATVSNGTVRGIEEGTVTITATFVAYPEVSASIEITVIPKKEVEKVLPDSIVIIGEDSVEEKYTIRLAVDVLPAGADASIRWESTKPEIATIDDKGNVTGVSEGTTYIIAYSALDETIKSSRYKLKVTVDQTTLIPVVDLQGYEISIMIADSAVNELDPFNEEYITSDKLYKQRAWSEVEAKYNCTIKVTAYPDDASWGPSRYQWINSNAALGKAQADFFVVSSSWLRYFLEANSMVATTQFFAKFGKNQIEPAARQGNSRKGELYVLGTGVNPTETYPYNVLIYNVGLVEKLKLESPAKMFNEGRWSFDDFVNWCLSAQALLPEGSYAASGYLPRYWQGMCDSSNLPLVNVTSLQLNVKHQFSIDAIESLKTLYLAGAMHNSASDVDDVFSNGNSLIMSAELWFAKASNRCPADLWGEDTRYGYVPYPYHPNVGKEGCTVYYGDMRTYIMAAAREYCHPAGVGYEDIYRPMIEMYLNTFNYMKADPSFDANAAKANINALKYDDPDSIEALNFFTSERTIYDPFSDIGGDLRTAVSNNVIVKNGDPIEVIDQYYDAVLTDLYTQFG